MSVAVVREYILLSVARSFRGHIGLLFSKRWPSIDLGPALELISDRYPVNCERTFAHSRGIKQLEAKYSGSSPADQKIFLEGFDAGAEWAAGMKDSKEPKSVLLP